MPTPFGSYTSSRNWRGAWEIGRWDNDGNYAYLNMGIYVARKPNDSLTKYYYISKMYDADGTGYSAAGAKALQPSSGSSETYAWHATHYFTYAMLHYAYTKRITLYIAKTDSSGKVNGSELTYSFDFGVPAKSSWWVGYNANGGTSTPNGFTKWFNENATVAGAISHAQTSPGNYTVSFNGHGGNTPSSLTSKRTTSYSFKNWNTAANGSGTPYNAGAVYSTNGGATLYAQWNTSESRAAVTLPNCTRTNYVFKGWYTAESGGTYIGTSGSSYTPTGNITLHAQWYAPYTVTFNANKGTGGPTSQVKVYNTNLVLSTSKPTRTGYSFVRWNTNTSDTGTAYNPGATYSTNANLTLYAIWNRTVSFNANYSGGTNPAALTSRSYTAITLPTMTRTGWVFMNWNTAANGSGTTYTTSYPADTSSVNYPGLTLYAQWKRNIDSVVVQGTANAMRINVDYIQVIPEGTENPLELNWYESIAPDMYLRSADQTVNPSKLYYRIEPIIREVDEGKFAYITVPVIVNGAAAADVSANITVASEKGVPSKVITYSNTATKIEGSTLYCEFVAMALDCDTDQKYNVTITVTATNTSVTQAAVTTTRKIVVSMAYYTMDVLGDAHLYQPSMESYVYESAEFYAYENGSYELVDLSRYDNLAFTSGQYEHPTEFWALSFELFDWLEAGQEYTLQLWDVNVSHSAKTEADLGIGVYYCEDCVLSTPIGPNYFTNGHADHITIHFTPYDDYVESQVEGDPAPTVFNEGLSIIDEPDFSGPQINVVNSHDWATGTMNLTVGAWKLEKGSVATEWTQHVLDVDPSEEGWYEKNGPQPGHGMAFGAPAVHESFNVAMPPECYGEPWIPTYKTSSIANFVVPNGVTECIVNDTSTNMLYRYVNGNYTPIIAGGLRFGNYNAITWKKDTSGQGWGEGIVIGAGGATIIGGGESAQAMANTVSNGDSEVMYVCNDNGIAFYPNCQNGAPSYAQFKMTADSDLWIQGATANSIGSDSVGAKITFLNQDGSQWGRFIFTDYDVVETGASVTFITNQSQSWFRVQNLRAYGQGYSPKWNTTSDKRLKDHIAYLGKEAVKFVKSLLPAKFKMNDETKLGFYAQDIEGDEIYGTDMVSTTGEDEIRSLDYNQLIAPLVAAVQDLTQRVEELEERIGE